jgi:hypothetical protein
MSCLIVLFREDGGRLLMALWIILSLALPVAEIDILADVNRANACSKTSAKLHRHPMVYTYQVHGPHRDILLLTSTTFQFRRLVFSCRGNPRLHVLT